MSLQNIGQQRVIKRSKRASDSPATLSTKTLSPCIKRGKLSYTTAASRRRQRKREGEAEWGRKREEGAAAATTEGGGATAERDCLWGGGKGGMRGLRERKRVCEGLERGRELARGAGTFGHLSDSFLGRKGSLTIVCILNTICGCLTALSPNYWIYLLLRFATGFSTGGVGLCAFVLATEPVGPTKRGAAGMSTFYFFSTGIALLSLIAYIFPSWRTLYIASSLPSLLFLLLVIPFISESPRWYLVRGRLNEAMNIMRSIAKSNGKHLPDGVTLALDEDAKSTTPTTTTTNLHDQKDQKTKDIAVSGSLVDVIRSPVTRIRLFLVVAINFLCSVVYYGLSLNVVNLETNLYINVLLNAVAEMPAYTITAILLDKFGRKPLAVGTLWFSGFFCFAGSLVGNVGVLKVVRMVCGVLGIFGVAGTYNLLFIYTVELFPT
ncbi:hypothetical protein TIFTF001_041625, partial [Ficus carica]